jgi:TRAP-type C4-dicarboxylate transport system permease small subunit
MKSWITGAVGSLEWLAGALLLALFLLNMLRIFLRYFLGVAWLWEPDLSRLLFIWIIFIGATVLYAGNGHLGVDYFLNRMQPGTLRRMHFVIDLVTLVFFTVLVVKGVEITKVRMRIPFDTWDLPTGYAYVAVPVCGALMILVTLVKIADSLMERRQE